VQEFLQQDMYTEYRMVPRPAILSLSRLGLAFKSVTYEHLVRLRKRP